MQIIGYREWGLIPLDTHPDRGTPTEMHPPMLTAVSLDQDTSLVFALRTAPTVLQITAEVTGLTGDNRGSELFLVSLSQAGDAYTPHAGTVWEQNVDGMFVLFSTRIKGTGPYIKLTFTEKRPIVLNRIEFASI